MVKLSLPIPPNRLDNNTYTTFTPTGATYDAATGDLVLTIGTNFFTTSSLVALERDSITFTCADDGNDVRLLIPIRQ